MSCCGRPLAVLVYVRVSGASRFQAWAARAGQLTAVITPDAPVSQWPTEAVQTALERGDLADWHRIVAAMQADPWGRTARQVEEVLSHSRPYGVAEAVEAALSRARERA